MQFPIIKRASSRFGKYLVVGVSTYLIDLALVFILTATTAIPYTLAIGIGFVVGISINYHYSYHWVFRGTERSKLQGYIIFALLGLSGAILIMLGTHIFVEQLNFDLYIARTIVGAFLGTVGFLINALLNFKVL